MTDTVPWRDLRRVAIMGGTFDPIHLGHLAVAEEVRGRKTLDLVVFMPAGTPPHKKDYQVSAGEDRYLMTVLATNSNPYFAVSRLEIERQGPSYTIDTIRKVRVLAGSECEIFFITGADAILEILTWRNGEGILRESHVIAVHRPGFDLERLAATIGPDLAAQVEPLVVRGLDISSTDLRARVSAGRSIRYLTPQPVLEYLHRRRLYR